MSLTSIRFSSAIKVQDVEPGAQYTAMGPY